MSLNFQFTDKDRFNKLTKEEKEWNNAFIWMTMVIDLGEITEKNAEEWVWRWKFQTALNGACYYIGEGEKSEPYIPTLEEVRKRIGLRTNVSNKTRNQFIQKQVRIFSAR